MCFEAGFKGGQGGASKNLARIERSLLLRKSGAQFFRLSKWMKEY